MTLRQLGYYNASANTTYYLTNVYATVSGKINSANASIISNTTLPLSLQ